MDLKSLLNIVSLAIKLAVLIFEKQKQKPMEERRVSLSELDDAIKKANDKKDLTEVSKWLGSKL